MVNKPLRWQYMTVLKMVPEYEPCTAEQIDMAMRKRCCIWGDWAEEWMPKLAKEGWVSRTKEGKEMVCSITDEGKEALKKWRKMIK